ncbi:MAG: hypothetical protein JO048_10855 [Methylobacteriaceae bacterium]|nr:hypothetical protein [Methylobacteriaceae bacterium]
MPHHPTRLGPALRAAVLAALSVALAGCIDLGLARSVVFAPSVPGLPADERWTPLPVDSWVTEGAVRPLAVSACFASACPEPAAIGLFLAEGQAGRSLSEALASPDRVLELLAGRAASERRRAKPPPRLLRSAEPLRAGAYSGELVRATRRDGSGAAILAALTRPAGDGVFVLLIVAPNEDRVRRLARAVAESG